MTARASPSTTVASASSIVDAPLTKVVDGTSEGLLWYTRWGFSTDEGLVHLMADRDRASALDSLRRRRGGPRPFGQRCSPAGLHVPLRGRSRRHAYRRRAATFGASSRARPGVLASSGAAEEGPTPALSLRPGGDALEAAGRRGEAATASAPSEAAGPRLELGSVLSSRTCVPRRRKRTTRASRPPRRHSGCRGLVNDSFAPPTARTHRRRAFPTT